MEEHSTDIDYSVTEERDKYLAKILMRGLLLVTAVGGGVVFLVFFR